MQVMTTYKMGYAKAHLASLIKEALAGHEIVIARDVTPLVRLAPLGLEKGAERRPGGDLEGHAYGASRLW